MGSSRYQSSSIGDFRNKELLGCLDVVKSKKPYQLMAPFNANAAEMEVMNKVGAKLRELGLYTFCSMGVHIYSSTIDDKRKRNRGRIGNNLKSIKYCR